MSFLEELLGNLTEIVYESNGGISLHWIVNTEDVNIAFIKEMMEHVGALGSGLALLSEPEYQIYPLVKVGGHQVTLQSLAVNSDELPRVILSPGWEMDKVERFSALFGAQVEIVPVGQEVW